MKEKLRMLMGTLGLASSLMGCEEGYTPSIQPDLAYTGVLKRGQPVRFSYKGVEHKLAFDSLRVFSKDWKDIEESTTRYFTLDGEKRPVSRVLKSSGEYLMHNDLGTAIKTKEFQITFRGLIAERVCEDSVNVEILENH